MCSLKWATAQKSLRNTGLGYDLKIYQLDFIADDLVISARFHLKNCQFGGPCYTY